MLMGNFNTDSEEIQMAKFLNIFNLETLWNKRHVLNIPETFNVLT